MVEVLDRRALNRALLARQLLLERADLTPADAIEHLVGMQSQAPSPPFVGLWTRLERFDHDELDRLMTERAVVRMALMRSTIHLVTARDALALRPLLQPVVERTFAAAWAKRLDGVDVAEATALARRLLEDTPMTARTVGEALAERWPGRDLGALGEIPRAYLPLVQVPPRGLWRRSGPAAHTTAEHWLGRPLDARPDVDDLVRRYLAAFGPASVNDAQTWSGLRNLREAFERLRPALVTFRDERGVELFDLPDAPRPGPDAPAPVRLLPEWDNLLLSHAERTRIVDDDIRRQVWTVNGIISSTVLVDGFVAATWRIDRSGRSAAILVEPFGRLAAAGRKAIIAEAERMLERVAADAATTAVRFA